MAGKRPNTQSIPELQLDHEHGRDGKAAALSPQKSGETARWYLGQGETWSGPFTDEEIVCKIEDGVISWVDFVWTASATLNWQRIGFMEAFQSYLPKKPSANLIHDIIATVTPSDIGQASARKIKQVELTKSWKKKKIELDHLPSKAGSRRSVWFMQFEGSEFGPLSLAEIQVILKSGKLKGKLFARREGVLNWMEVGMIPELSADVAAAAANPPPPAKEKAPPAEADNDDRRGSRRVPLVATVRFNVPGDSTAGSNMYMGVCRDISTHGVLIMSNRVPHDTIETMQLEVSPLGSTGVEPFVAEVEVVRILSDKKGFSVRFKKVEPAARAAIQKYLSRHS